MITGRDRVITIIVAATMALATTAAAKALLINVNIDTAPRTEATLDGPVNGLGGSDLGTAWNQLIGGPGNPG